MVDLEWPRDGHFTDRERGEQYEGPGTFDVPEEAVDEYLDRGWKPAEDEADEEAAGGAEEDEEPVVEGMTPPSDRETLEAMSYDQLRKFAAEADRDDVHGGSKKDAIIDAFAEDGDGDEE